MGKKRRAIAHPNKFKARARIMDRLRKIPTAPISNSEAVEELQQKVAPAPEVEVTPTPEPVVEPEPVAAASAEVEEPAPAKPARPARKKATRTRRTTAKKTDSSEA